MPSPRQPMTEAPPSFAAWSRESGGEARARMRRMLAVAAVCVALAIPLSLAAAGPGTFAIDHRITRAAQDHTILGWEVVERVGYLVGTSALLVPLGIVATLLFFVARRPDLAWLFAGVLALRPLNTMLKLVIESPRPTPDEVNVLRDASSNGFPSGHVAGTLLMAGVAVYVAPRLFNSIRVVWLVRALALTAVVATSYSRVVAGAHWPSDVLGGLLWGMAQLMVLIVVVGWLARRGHGS